MVSRSGINVRSTSDGGGINKAKSGATTKLKFTKPGQQQKAPTGKSMVSYKVSKKVTRDTVADIYDSVSDVCTDNINSKNSSMVPNT